MFSDCAAVLRRRPVGVIAAGVTLMAIIAGSGIPTSRTETSISALWIKTHGQVRSELDYLDTLRLTSALGASVLDTSTFLQHPIFNT